MAETGRERGEAWLQPAVLNGHPLAALSRWAWALDGTGRPWLAYYAADGTLYVRRPDGSEVDLRPRSRVSAMSGLALEAGDRLGLVWRDKLPRKALYHATVDAAGDEPRVTLVDAETEPLTRLEIARRGAETYVLWYGEGPVRRPAGRAKRYEYYLSILDDHGRTRSGPHRVMPGIYPTWIVDRERIALFSFTSVAGRPVIAMRRFDPVTGTLDELRTLAEVPPIGPFLFALRSGDRWLVMWLAHHGRDFRDLLLEGIGSSDQGEHWEPFSLPALRGLDVSQIDRAADDRGSVLLALTGAFTFRDPRAKRDLYVVRSGDGGRTWSVPVRLRPDDARFAHADHPSVAFGAETGSALVVWEDWRDIRAGVYGSHSDDAGATWLPEPVPLDPPGVRNVGLEAGEKAIREVGGRFQVLAQRFRGDDLALHDLVAYGFTARELRALGERTRRRAGDPDTQRLRERIAAYWRALEEGRWEAAYPLLDPFFRSRRPLEAYLAHRGRIVYHGHRVGPVAVTGRLARVTVEVEASVPPFTLATGQTVSRPRERHTIAERWLFVGDDWYREYREEPGDLRFTRY